ncbi:MAG: sugar phosphate nucleotidyltransferase [Hyphomicrobiales bacterium]
MGHAGKSESLDDCVGVVLAGGKGSRLFELTEDECKPAIPFAGSLRIIDFTLANAVNSGLKKVLVATQYLPATLSSHLRGRWRVLFGRRGGTFDVLVAPADATGGTATVIGREIERIDALAARHVLVAAGDHVYQMDYRDLLAEHLASGADATVATHIVDIDAAQQLGVARVDRSGRVLAFAEKPEVPAQIPGEPAMSLASMGIYLFDWPFLRQLLAEGTAQGMPFEDFGRDVLPAILERGHLQSHRYAPPKILGPDARPYWRDVGTLDAFHGAHLDLIAGAGPVATPDWPLHVGDLSRAIAEGSQPPPGCLDFGRYSVVETLSGPQCVFGIGCQVQRCVLMEGAAVSSGARIRGALIAPGTFIPPGLVVGEDPDEDARWFRRGEAGTVLVTRQMVARWTDGQRQLHQMPGRRLGTAPEPAATARRERAANRHNHLIFPHKPDVTS